LCCVCFYLVSFFIQDTTFFDQVDFRKDISFLWCEQKHHLLASFSFFSFICQFRPGFRGRYRNDASGYLGFYQYTFNEFSECLCFSLSLIVVYRACSF